jgi:hypothetical protein
MAEYVELFIDQGADFSTTINMNDDDTNLPQNISGFIVTSQLRRSILSQNASASFACSVPDPVNGEILIEMNSGNTSNLRTGTYFFDVRIKDTLAQNSYSRLIEGVVYVMPSVTRL